MHHLLPPRFSYSSSLVFFFTLHHQCSILLCQHTKLTYEQKNKDLKREVSSRRVHPVRHFRRFGSRLRPFPVAFVPGSETNDLVRHSWQRSTFLVTLLRTIYEVALILSYLILNHLFILGTFMICTHFFILFLKMILWTTINQLFILGDSLSSIKFMEINLKDGWDRSILYVFLWDPSCTFWYSGG